MISHANSHISDNTEIKLNSSLVCVHVKFIIIMYFLKMALNL